MELLYPTGLWWLAVLPLLLVPYLIRERPRRRIVSALFLFGDPSSAQRPGLGRNIRLPPRFLLQLALLLLILAALVRPAFVFNTTRSAIVLDNSASMAVTLPNGQTRFDELQGAAATALDATDSVLWDVWVLSPRPHPVAEGVSPNVARARIAQVSIDSCPDPPDERLSQFFTELGTRGYAHIHVITDRGGITSGIFLLSTVGETLRNREVVDPTETLAVNQHLENQATAIKKRSVLIIGSESGGLEKIPGVKVEIVPPSEFRPELQTGYDLILFHRAAPNKPLVVPTIYIMPPAASFLPHETNQLPEPNLGLPDPTSPLVSYLEPAALRLKSALVFAPRDGWKPLITGRGGATLLIRGTSAVVGFDLLPYLGSRNRPVSILTLNLLARLGNVEPDGTDCVIAGSREANLLEAPPLPFPNETAATREETHSRPLWQELAAAALLLLLIDAVLPGRAPLPAWIIRAVVAGLLLAAALDLMRTVPGEPGDPILLVDQSASLLPKTRTRLLAEVGDNISTVKRTISFGSPTDTNLESMLDELITKAGKARQAILISDGWETIGEARSVLPTLTRRGIRIDVHAAIQSIPGNVAVERLSLPPTTPSGNSVAAEVMIDNQNDRNITGTLTLRNPGKVLWREPVDLAPGSNILRTPVLITGQGLKEFTTTFEADDDSSNLLRNDDSAKAWLSIAAGRRVLLISDAPASARYLREALSQRGISVTSQSSGPLPALDDFAAVVLNNIPAHAILNAEAERLRDWVRRGGALVMIGGRNGFGLGSWAGSPIEQALPVRAKPRERDEPRTAVVLLIDKSGSMRQERRILYAREAARELVARLKPRDQLAIIGFDRRPSTIVPLSRIQAVRDKFEQRIAGIQPRGGTRLYPALVEAQRQLFGKENYSRHIIILSDGLSEDAATGAGRRNYYDLALALAQSNVTISTIALGGEADATFLERLASFGRGAFHQTDDPTNLPQLVLRELDDPGEERTFREGTFRTHPARDSRIIGDFARGSPHWPAVLGFVETILKPGANIDVASSEGHPLIASWRYGSGRSVAVTTDANGRWSARWVRWNEWSRLWTSILDWLAPQPTADESRFTLGIRDHALQISYLRFDEDPPGPIKAHWVGPATAVGDIVLDRTAPGRFEGTIPASIPGDYQIEIEGPQGRITNPAIGFAIPEQAVGERAHEEPDWELLQAIAKSTGGHLNPTGAEIRQRPDKTPTDRQPLAPFLLPFAILLYLGELVIRRVI